MVIWDSEDRNHAPQKVQNKSRVNSLVLVIDDNIDLLANHKAFFSSTNYDYLSASDGKEGIDLAVTHKPCLILSDIQMPGLDGFEVCRELKNCIETKNIPIMMVTSLDGQEDITKALECGASDYITKPFTYIVLLRRIELLLKEYKNITNVKKQNSLYDKSCGNCLRRGRCPYAHNPGRYICWKRDSRVR